MSWRAAQPTRSLCVVSLAAVLGFAGCQGVGAPTARTDAPAPHLVLRLEAGCRLEPGTGILVSAAGRVFEPSGHVPAGTRIEPRIPGAVDKKGSPVDAESESLARYVQVVFPQGVAPAAELPAVREWPCVESAALAPVVSLPE